jgi:hypothetical protein
VVDWVWLRGVTTLWGGSVIKFDETVNASLLQADGQVVCRTDSLRPVTFTSANDNTIGGTLSGSTGNPGVIEDSDPLRTFHLDLFSLEQGTELKHLRFRYAHLGVGFDLDGVTNSLSHAQFVHCQFGVYGDTTRFHLRNALFYDVATPIVGQGFTATGEHLTVHQSGQLATQLAYPGSLALTNSLLVNVTNSGNVSLATYAVVTGTTNLFQTVGAGAHYLATNATNCIDQGVTNLSAGLLDELKATTTHPPVVLTNAVATNAWLTPVVPREDCLPDIGYHYPAADLVLTNLGVTNGMTLSIAPGTVILCYDLSAIWLQDASQLICEGTPRQRIHLARYTAAQEQPLSWGLAWSTMVNNCHFNNPAPTARFRFTDFDGQAGMVYHLCAQELPWTWADLAVRDCSFNGGIIVNEGPAGTRSGWTNNLFEWVAADAFSEAQFDFYNNHSQGGLWLMGNLGTNIWHAHDNVFVIGGVDDAGGLTSGHNAYLNLTDANRRLSPTEAGDVVTNNFTFQPGPLGDYYQLSTNLLNKGSRYATNAGLA